MYVCIYVYTYIHMYTCIIHVYKVFGINNELNATAAPEDLLSGALAFSLPGALPGP